MTKFNPHKERERDYDVCLSFAGENRRFIRKVAEALKEKGLRTFFDEYEEIGLWGKDLYEHLDDIYSNAARYCVIFASRHYAKKVWTNHERRSAQERALVENKEYILPARFDNTPIPGIRDTVGYINIAKHSPESFAQLLLKKVGPQRHKNYFPPYPDRLFKILNVKSNAAKPIVAGIAESFFTVLKRMSKEERKALFALFFNACPAEMPKNLHMNIDLLRRISGFPASKLLRLFKQISSLGFSTKLRKDDETPERIGKMEMIVLEWHDLSTLSWSLAKISKLSDLVIARAMVVGATANYCPTHGSEALERLDFSQLSTSTTKKDTHFKGKKAIRPRKTRKYS